MKKDDVRIDGLSPTIKYYDYSNYKQVKTNDHKSQIFFRQNHNRYILVLFHFSCHKLNSRSFCYQCSTFSFSLGLWLLFTISSKKCWNLGGLGLFWLCRRLLKVLKKNSSSREGAQYFRTSDKRNRMLIDVCLRWHYFLIRNPSFWCNFIFRS